MHCSICKSTRTHLEGLYRGCLDCGHFEFVDTINLTQFHSSTRYRSLPEHGYSIDGKPSTTGIALRKLSYIKRVNFLSQFLVGVDSAFDIGCSAGGFGKEIQSVCGDVSGIECSECMAKASNVAGVPCIHGDFMTWTPTRKYDAVFSFHVIEHARDAVAFVSKQSSIANKIVVVEIPTQRKMPPYFRGHVHWFSDRSFDILLSKTKRNILKIAPGFSNGPSLIAVLGPER